MPCHCIEPKKKKKVFETVELDYENNKEYRIIEFICEACNRYGVEKTEKIELKQSYDNDNFSNYQRVY